MALTSKKLVDTHRVGGGWCRRPGKRGKVKNPEVLKLRRDKVQTEEFTDTETGETYTDLRDSTPAPRRGVRPQGWNRKDFGENLNPLWRYLQKQTGRNWDKVYSEICGIMDRRSTVGGHIFEHLFDFVVVANEVRIINGVPNRVRPYLDGFEPITYKGNVGEWGCFYVDPRDNKLKHGVKPKPPEWEVRAKNRTKLVTDNTRDLGGNRWFCRDTKSGLWYRVVYKPQVWHHYTQEVTRWKREGRHSYATDPYGRMIPVKEVVHRKEALVAEAPHPDTLVLPKVDKDMVLASCRSASKKDLRNYV